MAMSLSDDDYPSAKNVPFPYETPYPQQINLMDALLESLRRADSDASKEMKDYTSRVILLESPTGTGKSLSLACASLAWLRYRERVDLLEKPASETTTLSISDVNATECDSSKDDWLSSWANPVELEREKLLMQQKLDCIKLAKSSRNLLSQNLNSIRSKLERKLTLSFSGNNQTQLISKQQRQSMERARREELVSSAINQQQMQSTRFNHLTHRRLEISKVNKQQQQQQQQQQDDQFCVDYYVSDNEEEKNESLSEEEDDLDDSIKKKQKNDIKDSSSLETKHSRILPKDFLDGGKLDGSGYNLSTRIPSDKRVNFDKHKNPTVGNVMPASGVRKIIYAARTHSQLSQFVSEVRKTHWSNDVRICALGGRKILCGNDNVNNEHKSEATVTEHCLDLQKGDISSTPHNEDESIKDETHKLSHGNFIIHKGGKKRSSSETKRKKKTKNKCPLMASKDAISTLALHMLSTPSDIEDIASLGVASKTCAYYASREALAAAEIVVLPYSLLLSIAARHSVGLCLKSCLVLIDEAHNIPEILRSISSSNVTLPVIESALTQLVMYTQRYKDRLAGRNLFYLGQIRRCLTAMIKYLKKGQKVKKSEMMTSTELLFRLKLDNFNLFKVLKYLERSRLSQKLLGFHHLQRKLQNMNQSQNNLDDQKTVLSKHVSPLSIIQNFFVCLIEKRNEGKIIVEYPSSQQSTIDDDDSRLKSKLIYPSFRYVLLNPSAQFKSVLQEAHAVVLAGGTMRPFNHIATELLSEFDGVTFCKEAYDAEKKSALSLAGGQSSVVTMSKSLTAFTCNHVVPSTNVYMSALCNGPNNIQLDFRHSNRTSDFICDELGKVILNFCGIVPAGIVVFLPSYSYEAHLVRYWKKTGLFDQIDRKKKIFREPQNSRDLETCLKTYARQAISQNGSILFCVIGGKMSEGINFADDMARCVFVVGLPYPDITCSEMKEKMSSLDESFREKRSMMTGNEYYHNLCMRAVNQSIGRAIRHVNDYAAIILVDRRYANERRIWNGLPFWLRKGESQVERPFGQIRSSLHDFFKDR